MMITSPVSYTKLAYGGQWPIFSSWLKSGMRILIEKFVKVMVCRGQIIPFSLIVIGLPYQAPRQIKLLTAHAPCKLT